VLLSSRICASRSRSFHQADHADSVKLGNGEVNNRVSGGVVQGFLTRIWIGPNLDGLSHLILDIINARPDFDTADLRSQSALRARKLRCENIDHHNLTIGEHHIDSEGIVIMEDYPIIPLRGNRLFRSLRLANGRNHFVGR